MSSKLLPVVQRVPRSPALFVGRARELDRFAEATQAVRLVLVYGVAGVGKTAFMLRASEGLAARLGARLSYHRCRPGESMATVAAAALKQLETRSSGRSAAVTREPVGALLAAVKAAPVVLCLDDAQRVDDAGLFQALAQIAAERPALWLCVTSREALPVSPADVDHLVLKLGALGPEESRALWEGLQRLYGPGPGSLADTARRDCRTPLLLKQAFAGPAMTTNADPLGLGSLPGHEADLLAELCAFRQPVPVTALTDGRDHVRTGAAVQSLVRRFLVELPDANLLGVHDLVREAAARAGLRPTVAQHRRCLAYYRDLQLRDPADEAVELEVLHHAAWAGEDETAAGILVQHAAVMRRLVPTSAVTERELWHAVDALEARGPIAPLLRLVRARARARLGQLASAYEEARAVARDGEAVAEVALAEICHVLGRAEEAITHATRAAANEALGTFARVWAHAVLVEALRGRGAMAEAEGLMAQARSLFDAADTPGQAVRHWLAASLAYDCEDYRAAEDALREMRRAIERSSPGLILAPPVFDSLERVVRAARGQPGSEVAPSEIFDDTLYFRLAARMFRAEELLYRGEARAAAALAEASVAAAAAGRQGGNAVWGVCLLGESWRLLGRLEAATAQLESAIHAAQEAGLDRDHLRLQAVLARVLLSQGQLEAAREVALQAVPRISRAPATTSRLRAVIALAEAAGTTPAAKPKDARAPVRAGQGLQGFEAAEWRTVQAEVRLWQGQLQPALKEALAAEAAATRGGWRWLSCRAGLLAAEALLRRGEFEPAELRLAAAQLEADAQGYCAESLLAGLLGVALGRTRGVPIDPAPLTALAARAEAHGCAIEAEAARLALAGAADQAAPARSAGARLARRLGLTDPACCVLRAGPVVRRLTSAQLAAIEERRYELFIDLVGQRVRTGRRWADLAAGGPYLEVIRALACRPTEARSQAELHLAGWGVEFHALRHRGRVAMAVHRLRERLGEHLIEATHDGYRLRLPRTWAVIEPL